MLARISVTIFVTFTIILRAYGSEPSQQSSEFDIYNQKQLSSIEKRPIKTIDSETNEQENPSLASNNFYINSQAQKFRVNVSNLCEKTQMRVTIRVNKPFYGLIHTKDKRRKVGCFVEGNGDQTYTMEIRQTLVQSEPEYCGVVSNPMASSSELTNMKQTNQKSVPSNNSQTLSVILVVRLHKTIEFSEDRYFLLSCANRCPRSDCSSHRTSELYNNEVNSHRSNLRLESSPSRGSDFDTIMTMASSRSNNLKLSDQQIVVSPTEGCNYILGLKFQWLVKLSWILSSLLLIVLCISFFLCLTLNKRRISEGKQRMLVIPEMNKQPQQYEGQKIKPNFDSEAHESSKFGHIELADSSASTNKNCDTIENLQNKNSYVPFQQQQVFGRSTQGLYPSKYAANEPIRRRRSMCGSSTQLATDKDVNQRNRQPNELNMDTANNRMDPKSRSKSKSQTTIYYDQAQDPFRTIPFNYVNNGYVSDQLYQQSASTGYVSYDMTGDESYGDVNQNMQTQGFVNHRNPRRGDGSSSESIPQAPRSLPGNDASRGQLGKFTAQPDSNNNQMVSQFDPNNTRQLMNLIQQKHRHQMAHANLTAASIHQKYLHPDYGQAQTRAWK